MKHLLTLLLSVFIFEAAIQAQAPQLLNYQGVARNGFGNALPNRQMTLRLSIRNGSSSGTVVYSETRTVTTNGGGLYSVQIGSTGTSATTGSIATINWQVGTKFLQVEVDPDAGTNFVDLGTTQLVSVPYAMSAGVATPGGSAGGDLSGTYPNPTVANSAINTIKLADAAVTTLKLADQSVTTSKLADYSVTSAKLADLSVTSGKLVDASVTTAKIADANVTTAKLADASVTDAKIVTVSGSKVTGNIAGSAANVTGTVAVANGGTGATTAAAARTNLGLGNVDNTSDLNKPISTATQAALDLKENLTNKSITTTLGTSDVLYPTQNAVKSYVDGQIVSNTTPDATTTVKGKVQLAGDLTGTAASPSVATGAITTTKLADASVTDAKIVTVSGSKVTGNIAGNAATVTTNANLTGPVTSIGNATAIANGAITNAMLANSAVANLSGTNTGDQTTITGNAGTVTNGVYTVGDQTIAGVKTFSSTIVGSVSGNAATVTTNANLTGPVTSVGNATAIADGALSIAKTSGLQTALDAKESLSNKSTATTLGASDDLYPTQKAVKTYVDTRVASSGAISSLNGLTSATQTFATGTTGTDITITSSGSAHTINIPSASSSARGVVTTGSQTFEGTKTFSKDIIVNSVTIGKGGATQADNIAIGNGARSGNINTGGNANIAIGTDAQKNNTGYYNVSVGNANLVNGSGDENTAIGYTVMSNNTSGIRNTGVGLFSFYQNTTGNYNTAVGYSSLGVNTIGSYNTAVGTNADVAANNLSNATAIGYGATVAASNTIQLGNTSVSNVKTSGTLTAGTVTYPNSHGTNGQVLSTTSSGTLVWATPSTTATAYSGILPGANGGTGVANTGKTITLGGNLTTSGSFATTLTSTGTTSVTLPTNGTLSTLSGTETLTNKTLISPTITGTGSIAGTFTGNLSGDVTGNVSGNAATVTTNANLTGVVTSVGNATAIADGALSIAKTSGLQTAIDAKVFDAINDGTMTIAPSQNAVFDALALKASLVSPIFTGTPLAPTATAGDNTTQVATTAFVTNAVASGSATNVTGTVAVANGGTGLTSITSGQIPFGNGTSAIGTSSNLTWDNSTGSLGIGTSTPGNGFNTKLDVVGSTSFRTNSSDIGLKFDGYSPSGTLQVSRIYTDATSGTPGDFILGTYPNGHLNQLYLKQSNGFVGIRTTSPTTALDVNGTVTATSLVKSGGTSSQFLMADGTATSSPSLSSATGLPLTTGVTGSLPVANGGTGATTAAGAITNLGGTTVGGNFFTLTNPSAITFPRINANNTIEALSASDFRTAIGAGTSSTSGTVTSVAALTLGTTGTDLSSSVANGATTPVITLNVPDASATARGVVTTSAQTFAGAKTFSSDLTVNGIIVGKGLNSITNNTAIGTSTLAANTTGSYNTANGYQSLYSNTTGVTNTANGYQSLYSNTTGEDNTAIGVNAISTGSGTTNGSRNTAVGRGALQNGNSANDNTAIGAYTMNVSTTGSSNVALGNLALYATTSASYNVGVGFEALKNTTTGGNNTAIGRGAMLSNTSGDVNTAVGENALVSNTTGRYNTSIGVQAQEQNTIGGQNTAIGVAAIDRNTSGSYNAVLGAFAGRYIADNSTYNTAINNSVLVGALARPLANNSSNEIVIGYNAVGNGSNTAQIGNSSITNVKTSGTLTAGSITYPNTAGTNGYYLKTDGSGTATWAAVPTSGVPYTGATGSVNLGAYDLTVNGITIGKGSGDENTKVGNGALASNSAYGNTAFGSQALYSSNANYNNAFGFQALSSNTTGSMNTAIGSQALLANVNGIYNGAFGSNALGSNISGNYNLALGSSALVSNISAWYNVAVGQEALVSTTGEKNTALGFGAGNLNTTGTNNTLIGYDSDVAAVGLTNATAIGAGATVAASNSIQLGNTSVTSVTTSGTITAAGLAISGNVTSTSTGGSISGFDAALNNQTGTSYTLTSSDNGKVVTLNNSSAITLTINTGLGDGFNCLIVQKGAGQITIAGTATRINRQSHTKTAGQYAVVSIVNIGSDNIIIAGDTGN